MYITDKQSKRLITTSKNAHLYALICSHSAHLSGVMFSIYNVFRSHSVVWSIMKVKLNSGVNIVQTSSADIVHSSRERHSKGMAIVWASKGFFELPVVVFQCERTQTFVMGCLGACNVNWWLSLSCTAYTSPVSRTWKGTGHVWNKSF